MALSQFGMGIAFEAKDLASGVMHKLKGEMGEVSKSAGLMQKAVGSSFGKLGTGLAIMGTGLVGMEFFGPAIETSMELSKAIALIGGESDEAVFPMSKMRDMTEQLAIQWGKAPIKQAESLYDAVGMGADNAAKSMSVMNAANTLAIAGNADLKISLNAIGGAIRAYNADWKDAMKFADTIRMAEATGKTTVEELAESLGRVTSMAASLGLTFEETTGAIAAMTSTGIKANMAVTGLHEAFANILHPSHDAQMEAARLGIKFNEATLKSKGFHGMLEQITHSANYRGVTSMKNLFTSVEGFNAIMQLTAGNMKGFDNAMEAMSHKEGDAKRGFDLMADTLSFQHDKFEANKKTIQGMIGQALEPMAKGVLKVANAFMEWVAKIPKPVIQFLTKVAFGIATFLTFVGAIIAAKAGIALLILGLKAAGVTVGGLAIVMLPAIITLTQIAFLLYGLKVAYEKNLGGFADFVNRIFDKVSLALKALGQLFSEGGFSGDVRKALDDGNKDVKNFAITVFLWFNRIKNFFEMIGAGFEEGMKKAKPTLDKFMGALEKLGKALGFVTEDNDPAKSGESWAKWGEMGGKVGLFLVDVFERVVGIITDVIDIVRGMAEWWKKAAPPIDKVGESFSLLSDTISQALVDIGLVNASGDDTKDTWGSVGKAIAATINVMVIAFSIFVRLVANGFQVLSSVIQEIEDVFVSLMDILQGIDDFVVGIFTGDWKRAWKGMGEIVYGALKAIIDTVFNFISILAGQVDSLMGLLGKKTNYKAEVQSTKKDVDGFVRKALSAEASLVSGPGTDVDAWGEMVDGLRKKSKSKKGLESTTGTGEDEGGLGFLQHEEMPAVAAQRNTGHTTGHDERISAALSEMGTGMKQPPIVIVQLDGEQIAAKIKSKGRADNERSFMPMPTPT